MVKLPESFLKWNYYPRRNSAKDLLEGRCEKNRAKLLLNSTRHTPTLCTAFQKPNGSLYINAKIVGVGYVPKKEFLKEAIEDFKQHLQRGDHALGKAKNQEKREKILTEYRRNAMRLLLKHLYLEQTEAKTRIDFTKMSTIELALNKPHSSKHTWRIVQKNRAACLLFYCPPNVSFELHGWIDIHEQGLYHEFVNLVHDAFHYVPPEKRQLRRPVYIFNVEEVYDNSPFPTAFGVRIA